MKKWYAPLAVIITITLLGALILLINANIWLFTDFWEIEAHTWLDVLKFVAIIVIDLCIVGFIVVNADEIAQPDYYDDDCE